MRKSKVISHEADDLVGEGVAMAYDGEIMQCIAVWLIVVCMSDEATDVTRSADDGRLANLVVA